jgi:hypothetical protein
VRRLERHALTTGRCVDSVRAITLAPLTSEQRAAVMPLLIQIDEALAGDMDEVLAALRHIERLVERPRRG